MDTLRKPAAKVPQSREPHSIRFSDSEWTAIAEEAQRRGVEPSRFVRKLCLTGLSMLRAQADMEDSAWRTA